MNSAAILPWYINVFEKSLPNTCINLWGYTHWYLLHVNAPTRRSQLVKDFLSKTSTNVFPHRPDLPDIAPCHFYMFPSTKKYLQGHYFVSLDDMKAASQAVLEENAKNGFQPCFQNLSESVLSPKVTAMKVDVLQCCEVFGVRFFTSCPQILGSLQIY